ncbi:MAG TPA: ubiquinol-cytochrome c reductase iron-sulfur subunit [Desulfobulbaceae bacterium]|nr:ubiquinol-cytochrome c reductase iron-sulfur subunit [Desulfobulbaceae bacterium]
MYNRLYIINTMPTTKADSDAGRDRRHFLARFLQWTLGLFSLILVYPLLRFLGYTVKPKPRHMTVAAPLPLSGYHTERDFILFAGDGKPFAVSRTCTHLGCRVNFLEDKQIIECPCHQSRFSPRGKVLSGPAKKNLTTLAVVTKKTADGEVKDYIVTL